MQHVYAPTNNSSYIRRVIGLSFYFVFVFVFVCTDMLGKAIWRLRIQENPSAAGAGPDPAEGAYSAPANPLVCGTAGCLSPPQEPHPPLSVLRASPIQLPSTPKLVYAVEH